MQTGSLSSLRTFLSSPVEDDLTSVPGIGSANASSIRSAGIKTTSQLIGKFFLLQSTKRDRGKATAVRCHDLQQMELIYDCFVAGCVFGLPQGRRSVREAATHCVCHCTKVQHDDPRGFHPRERVNYNEFGCDLPMVYITQHELSDADPTEKIPGIMVSHFWPIAKVMS